MRSVLLDSSFKTCRDDKCVSSIRHSRWGRSEKWKQLRTNNPQFPFLTFPHIFSSEINIFKNFTLAEVSAFRDPDVINQPRPTVRPDLRVRTRIRISARGFTHSLTHFVALTHQAFTLNFNQTKWLHPQTPPRRPSPQRKPISLKTLPRAI
jgi:hypothetical protein